ncbi:MAG TPA: TIGR01777 family oxidoreductase [Phaeodactylibacter sp.]|nr:TIGR01777 family oxidoreductase [Phaeodactylibacter sp.]
MPTVLIGGGSGLIGTRLSQLLQEKGYDPIHLSRRQRPNAPYPTYQWDAEAGTIEDEAVQAADYVINLAGAGIADKPWTKARKALIISSRVKTARLFKEAFERTGHNPKAYLSSSAIGYYGDRGETLMTEEAEAGTGFLSESTVAWESAIQEVAQTGTRTVGIRIGIVMSTQGGALEKMLIPFRFYTGTYFGDGQQWYSWVHIDDICRLFIHAMENESMNGFYNGVAPNPVRNKTLVEQIKNAMNSPAILVPAPTFALRLAMGEMADAVLDSTKVSAEKTQSTGFDFQFPEIEKALGDLL